MVHAFLILRTVTAACSIACMPDHDVNNALFHGTLLASTSPVIARSGPAGPVEIEVAVNGKPLRAKGAGECTHEPNASIYSTPASLWRVEYSDPEGGDLQYLSLSVWQLKKVGENQMSLSLRTGARSYSIATVKGGRLVGTGQVTFRANKPGGRFEIRGSDAQGATIEAKISCPTFGSITAEGG
ncbi:hypothetical protein [Candidatus Nitrospira bockiana]